MDGEVFYGALQGGEQTKPFGIQGVFKFFKRKLKSDGHDTWYFVVWFMAATGARVSELLHIKVEHVKVGYLDLYSKGGKIRRLYIPKNLRTEAIKWLEE